MSSSATLQRYWRAVGITRDMLSSCNAATAEFLSRKRPFSTLPLKQGVQAVVQYVTLGMPMKAPYPLGSLHADAWFAGTQLGCEACDEEQFIDMATSIFIQRWGPIAGLADSVNMH